MIPYHKIQTVFKRDPETNYKTLLLDQFSTPAFEYLRNLDWTFHEKVDGTNIRVMFQDRKVTFNGKTDNANLPGRLVPYLYETFTVEKMAEAFDGDACLYGEGFGAGIQGGGKYGSEQEFCLFDVAVLGDLEQYPNHIWWLHQASVQEISLKLGVPNAPLLETGNLARLVELVREGFDSEWGNFRAEGIVARPMAALFDRAGNRVITKLKCKDFK